MVKKNHAYYYLMSFDAANYLELFSLLFFIKIDQSNNSTSKQQQDVDLLQM